MGASPCHYHIALLVSGYILPVDRIVKLDTSLYQHITQ